MLPAPIEGPAAWRGADLQASTRWIEPLDEVSVEAIVRAAHAAGAAGKTIATLCRDDFSIPTLASSARRWSQTLASGEGFVLLRGFPVERLGENVALAYAGLGLHLGSLVPQNRAGELLCDVRDRGVVRTGPEVRQYMTREAQDFHTDGADVVGLLCLRTAKSGGASRIVSSIAIYNEIGLRRPDLLPLLYAPVPFEGELAFELPIARVVDGRLRFFYIGWYIRDAQQRPDVRRLSSDELTLLSLIESIANDPRFFLDMSFAPGDIQLLNNATILHARTAYEDFPEPERKRHLLRLWLHPHDFASVEAELASPRASAP